MSGSTIGGVVGGVVGFFVGSPQLGWMIGSAIGGAVDPDKFYGPRLNDAQVQTSTEGVPRPIIYATSAVAGNIIQTGPLVETQKKKRTGKGGPVQVTYHYSRTYAIRICEGPIAGISRIWRDDKLVYDARNPADWPDDPNVGQIDADSAMFASRVTIYNGDEAQLPDPTLEALPVANGGGMGNVPAYRGTAYVVIANDDLTDRGGAVPQYRFEVVGIGSSSTPVAEVEAGELSRFVNGHWPLADAESDYTYTGHWVTGTGGGVQSSEMASIQAVLDYFAATDHGSGGPGLGAPSHYIGYVASSGASSGAPYAQNSATFSETAPQADVTDYQSILLLYQWVVPAAGWTTVNPGSSCLFTEMGGPFIGVSNGAVERRVATRTSLDYYSVVNCEGAGQGSGVIDGIYPLCIEVKRKRKSPGVPGGLIPVPDSPGYYTDADGNVHYHGGYSEVFGTHKVLSVPSLTGSDPTQTYSRYEYGPALAPSHPEYNNASYFTPYYDAKVSEGKLPAGWTAGNQYPVTVASAFRPDLNQIPTVSKSDALLSDVVIDIAGRVGVSAAQLEVSQLSDAVPGFVIGKQMTASDALSVLQQGFLFDLPEWDSKVRGIKRGGATLFDITEDDLVYSDDDEDVRAQAIEFPRKYNLVVPDASADYNPAKHTAARNTDNVKAVGEVTTELPINFRRDTAAQKAAILMKVAWTDAEGRMARILPEEFSQLTPSDPFTFGGKRWRADRVEYREGEVVVEARRDRVSAYSSGVTAGTILAPAAPRSSLRGPTVFAAMNLPRLRSADNVTGMYIAVQGILPGWQGCDLYLSTDGGLTEQVVATITDPATMGYLTAAVTASATTIPVKIYPGDELDTVTDAQIAARANGYAITTGSVSEVGQFKTAAETDTRAYDLTDLTRGQLGTAAASHFAGDQFVLLDGSTFLLPLDASLIGQTLKFRPVSRGTAPANNRVYDVVFAPLFSGSQTIATYTNAAGDTYTDASGNPYTQVS